MKVKVTLELEIEDGLDDRGSIDLAVQHGLIRVADDFVFGENDSVWRAYKINWEEI